MWRTSCNLFKQTLTSSIRGGRYKSSLRPLLLTSSYCSSSTTTTTTTTGGGYGGGGGGGGDDSEKNGISYAEAKRVMRLVNVEDLKKKLGMENREVIGYGELLEACMSVGVAKSADEATAFAKILDEAGVVLLFRDKVYLHPYKVVDLVRKAVPLALLPDDKSTEEELKKLHAKMEEIDILAHKQVRRILWTGLGFGLVQVGLFFRLTFWEFSWDVMEPIAFFTTATGIVLGYAYFLITSRDPTYQDFMKRLFLSRQRKLIKKHNFDIQRYVELQKKCKMHSPVSTAKRNGIEVEPEEIINDH